MLKPELHNYILQMYMDFLHVQIYVEKCQGLYCCDQVAVSTCEVVYITGTAMLTCYAHAIICKGTLCTHHLASGTTDNMTPNLQHASYDLQYEIMSSRFVFDMVY